MADRRYSNGPPEPPAYTQKPFETWNKPRKTACCPICYTQRSADDFICVTPFDPDIFFTDDKGEKRTLYCRHCIVTLHETLTEKIGDKYKALYRTCSLTCMPYDDLLAHEVFEDDDPVYPNGNPVSKYIPKILLYIRQVQDNGKYWHYNMDDYITPFEYITKQQRNKRLECELTAQGVRDRNEIIEKLHYDPFDKEPAADRNRLYADLVTLFDDAMVNDLVRQRAAIEIVKSFYRIDCIGQAIQELQSNTQSMMDNSGVMKELIAQKKKETDMVTAFSKDHGFAERYQLAKAKGNGTLSSIVRDGFESHFDRLAVNKFDIETSNAMQQVANISANSMLNQLQLTSDDYRNMITDQSHEIQELHLQVEKLKEANRLLREKQLKQELLDEYESDLRKKGITSDDVLDVAMKNASFPTYFAKDGGEQ